MLPAGVPAFRHFSRRRDQAVVAGHPAQCLPGRVCAAQRIPVVAGADDDWAEQASGGLWSDPSSPEAETLRRFDAAAVQALIARLPEPYRETLVLREINDLSYREIADVIGAPVGTVMSRLARARALLRAAWLAEEEEP